MWNKCYTDLIMPKCKHGLTPEFCAFCLGLVTRKNQTRNYFTPGYIVETHNSNEIRLRAIRTGLSNTGHTDQNYEDDWLGISDNRRFYHFTLQLQKWATMRDHAKRPWQIEFCAEIARCIEDEQAILDYLNRGPYKWAIRHAVNQAFDNFLARGLWWHWTIIATSGQ